MRRCFFALLVSLSSGCTREEGGDDSAIPGDLDAPPRWYVEPVALPLETFGRSFNAIFGYPDGNLFVVGQYGVILTNRAPEGTTDEQGTNIEGWATDTWRVMPTPTRAHLTAITGIANGADYGYGATYGEMFAVGWEGTVLHFHPDPDDNPQTLDGEWQLVASPEGAGLVPVMRVDPACPDSDGDGVQDDGNQTGFWGDLMCSPPSVVFPCDDNCRETANGWLRPIVDRQSCQPGPTYDPVNCACLGPGDDADIPLSQIDLDGDGRGARCDGNDNRPDGADPVPRFTTPLFGVEAVLDQTDGLLRVTAVGGDGALVTFEGPAVSATPQLPAVDVTNPAAWRAQLAMPYFYDDDCPGGVVPRGEVCPNAVRLPPSCAAQCNPKRRACGINCPVAEAPCCDPAASTGVGCSDTTCPPAPNACNAIRLGECETACADCFRRLDDTLRAVISDAGGGCPGCGMLAVGADGRLLTGNPLDPNNVWTGITCLIPPDPIEEATLSAVAAAGDRYIAVGSAGSIFFIDPLGDPGACQERLPGEVVSGGIRVESKRGAPGVFLRDVWAINDTYAFVVGDEGTFLEVRWDVINPIETDVHHTLNAIWSNYDSVTGNAVYWLAGAEGTLLRAEYR